ncbi:hypothetical protein HYDPIDRAFT_30295 [Hydnomerulius pinastri MD-312]|uniref:DUF6533 domain-containing protein n=1 Tax=Hydnomerulius pinastri MD-312 TaxID=994086 RepID=A0A0C9VAP5_9AGAM|nr:hypothetical protein HYDPIDRAFT_30295 [Hydnomerulius pinastri MD-312]
MSMTAAEVAEYVSGAHIIQLTRMCQMAPYVVMLYDHVLTFDQEVEHIWKRSWTSSTILYLILRYIGGAFGLFSAMGQWSSTLYVTNAVLCDFANIVRPMFESGNVFLYLQGWPASLTVWLVQYILQMRLYVLYGKSKKLLVCMGAAYFGEIIAMSTILLKANLKSSGKSGGHTVSAPHPMPTWTAHSLAPPMGLLKTQSG